MKLLIFLFHNLFHLHLVNVLVVLVSAFQILNDSKITFSKVDSYELFTGERNDSHEFLTSLKGNCYDLLSSTNSQLCHTVWCGKILYNAITIFTEKSTFFRQINNFTEGLSKKLTSRKFLRVVTFFRVLIKG